MCRAAAMAAPSVTRTSSRARLRSIGVPRSRGRVAISERSYGARTGQTGGAELDDGVGGTLDASGERGLVARLAGVFPLRDGAEESARQRIAGPGWIDDCRHVRRGQFDG